MKREKPYYSLKAKKQAVQLVAAGLLSEDEACQKYKISLTLLYQWQKWYDKFFIQPHLNPEPMAKKKLTDQEKIKQLEQRLKDAEQQLKYEKLKSKALDKMIDIAEEDLNIKIRKKPGAGVATPGQSKK
jgi:transposase